MRHLTLQQLSATVDQALSGVSLELVRRHLEECEECRARGSQLARVDGVVAQLVSHDPGDAWLAAVAVEIDERVRAEVAGRFDPPAHPAGPPPLEFGSATAVLTPEELEAIWEEGSTTPRPSSLKPRENTPVDPTNDAVPAPPSLAPAAGQAAPVVNSAPANPRPAEPPPAAKAAPIAKPAPVEKSATVAKPAPITPPAPVEKPAVAKAAPIAPSAPVTRMAPVVPSALLPKPAPVGNAMPPAQSPAAVAQPASPRQPAANEIAPAVTTRVPPLRRRAPDSESPVRWGQHADRIGRARREASNPQRETLVPLAFGLVGGALAGAFVVTLFFLKHSGSGSTPAAPAVHVASTSEHGAAIESPLSRPEIERAPAPEPTRVEATPVVPPREPVSQLAVPAPAQPRTITPRSPAPPSTPAHTPRAAAPPAATAGRAVPTGEESWPLLCGEVVDESGAPVTGARILLADLDVGARTDRRGRFCLAAPSGDRTLSVVALGFATQRREVTVANGAADVHVVLKAAP